MNIVQAELKLKDAQPSEVPGILEELWADAYLVGKNAGYQTGYDNGYIDGKNIWKDSKQERGSHHEGRR